MNKEQTERGLVSFVTEAGTGKLLGYERRDGGGMEGIVTMKRPARSIGSHALPWRDHFDLRQTNRFWQPRLPFAVAQVRFVDPTLPVNGVGTFASPLNALPETLVTNTAYLLRSGTTYTGSRIANVGNVVFGAYGSGPKPIWDAGSADFCLSAASGVSRIVIRDISFTGQGRNLVTNASTTSKSASIDWLITGCTFSLLPGSLAGDCSAIALHGANIELLANILSGVATHGAWIKGDNFEASYNIVRYVGIDGQGNASCIHVAEGTKASIHHNHLDHSNTEGGCCIFIGSTATDADLRYNVLTHNLTGSQESDVVRAEGAAKVAQNSVTGGRRGVFVGDASTIESNIVVNEDPAGTAILLGQSSGAYLVRNNTVISKQRVAAKGVRYATSTSPASLTIRNNIIAGFQVIGVEVQAVTTDQESSNCYWDNVINFDKSLSGSSVVLDPLLDEGFVPQQPALHFLGSVTDGAFKDIYGEVFQGAIGAAQYGDIDYDGTLLPAYF